MMQLTRSLLRSFLGAVAASDPLWKVSQWLGISNWNRLAHARAMAVRQRVLFSLGTPPRVASGPFAGMVFPDSKDRGGGWLPRVLGAYESELSEIVETIISDRPAHVIDIGCAEGYYVVGLAMRLPESQITAFDIADEERAICRRMADANAVGDRVVIEDACSEETLLSLDAGIRRLVICDCEGCEQRLITRAVTWHLRRSWFVIECHDFVVPGITLHLQDLLSQTHEVMVVASVPDASKADSLCVSAIADAEPRSVRVHVYGEGRPCLMHWVVAKPHE